MPFKLPLVFNTYVHFLNISTFQLYNELLNQLSFDPCNCSLKIRESTETPTPKVEAPLEV